jgi:predicted DNA binding protein
MLKQVSVSVKGENQFQDLAQKYQCKVNIVDCKHSNSREMSLLVEIEGKGTSDMIAELKSRQEVKRVYFAKSTPSKTVVMLILGAPLLCDVSRNSNAFCVSCPYNSSSVDGALEWNFLVKDTNDMARVMDTLQFRGAVADVRRITDALKEDVLTARQNEILLAAFKLGYFDFPRKKGVTELAKELSIKASTLSEILRKAESKIVKTYATGVRLQSHENGNGMRDVPQTSPDART